MNKIGIGLIAFGYVVGLLHFAYAQVGGNATATASGNSTAASQPQETKCSVKDSSGNQYIAVSCLSDQNIRRKMCHELWFIDTRMNVTTSLDWALCGGGSGS